jgi:hypothetical protein
MSWKYYRNCPCWRKILQFRCFRGQPAPVEEIVHKVNASQEKRRTSQPAEERLDAFSKIRFMSGGETG